MKKFSLFFILVAFAFSFVHPVLAVDVETNELILNPIADAYVQSDEPNSNFGEGDLHAYFWDFPVIEDERRNVYLMFDLPNFTTDVGMRVIIMEARLELFAYFNVGEFNLGVHYCSNNSWSETGITWNNAPSFLSTPTAVSSLGNGYHLDGWYRWNITSDVKNSIDFGKMTVVLKVLQDIEAFFVAFLRSKEAFFQRPKLVINYKTQYFLSVISAYADPQGEGWYDAGLTTQFSIQSSSVPVEGILGVLGVKNVFDHWSGDSTATTSDAEITMDAPYTVTAIWGVDYLPLYIEASITIVFVVSVIWMLRRRRMKET